MRVIFSVARICIHCESVGVSESTSMDFLSKILQRKPSNKSGGGSPSASSPPALPVKPDHEAHVQFAREFVVELVETVPKKSALAKQADKEDLVSLKSVSPSEASYQTVSSVTDHTTSASLPDLLQPESVYKKQTDTDTDTTEYESAAETEPSDAASPIENLIAEDLLASFQEALDKKYPPVSAIPAEGDSVDNSFSANKDSVDNSVPAKQDSVDNFISTKQGSVDNSVSQGTDPSPLSEAYEDAGSGDVEVKPLDISGLCYFVSNLCLDSPKSDRDNHTFAASPVKSEVTLQSREVSPVNKAEVASVTSEVTPVKLQVSKDIVEVSPEKPSEVTSERVELSLTEPELTPSKPEVTLVKAEASPGVEVSPSEPDVAPVNEERTPIKPESEVTSVKSEIVEVTPTKLEATPVKPVNEVSPAKLEVTPAKPESEVSPANLEVTSEVTPVKSEIVEVTPTKLEATPVKPVNEVFPAKLEVTPSKPVNEVSPAKLEVTPAKPESEVSPANLEVTSENSEVTPVKSEIVEVTPTKLEATPVKPVNEVFPAKLEVTPAKPESEVSPAKLEVSPEKLEVTPVKPESEVSPAKLEVTLEKPESEVTPARLEVTPAKPEVTPVKPEITPSEVTPIKPEVIPSKSEVTPVKPEVTSETVEVKLETCEESLEVATACDSSESNPVEEPSVADSVDDKLLESKDFSTSLEELSSKPNPRTVLSELFEICDRQQKDLELGDEKFIDGRDFFAAPSSAEFDVSITEEAEKIYQEILNASSHLSDMADENNANPFVTQSSLRRSPPPATKHSPRGASPADSPRTRSKLSAVNQVRDNCITQDGMGDASSPRKNSPDRRESSPKNCINPEINQSEAGPDIAEDANLQGGDVFKDPATFDFLNSVGNSNIASDLRKESLYVKFDPLVGNARTLDASVPLPPAVQNNNNTSSPQDNKVTPPRSAAMSVVDKLISLSPSPRRQQQQVITPAPTPVKQEEPANASMVEELYLLREILAKQDEKHQEDVSRLQRQMESLQAQLKECEERETRLNKKVAEKSQGQKQMSIIMEEYEKTISRLVAEKEQERQAHELDKASLVKERDTAMGHLANIEIAFSDLHKKYERSKTVIEGFKKNEEVLRSSLGEYEATIRKQEQKYDVLKSHAMAQLENANQELDSVRRSQQAEAAKLKAMLKKAEVKTSSLEEMLEQKVKENQELASICDELINKVGGSD